MQTLNAYLVNSLALPTMNGTSYFGETFQRAAAYFTNKPLPVAGGSDWLPNLAGQAQTSDYEQYARLTLDKMHYGMPQPWSFFSSSYAIVLVALAVLVNRIQNVVPPRRQFRLEPAMRISLRLPSLLFLARSTLLVLSKFAYGAKSDGIVLYCLRKVLSSDYAAKADSSVMWSVFLSLSIALLSEAFTKALNNDPRNHPSVNMLSISYLMHFHSTPTTSPILLPSPFTYLLIAMTLMEVLALHCMETFELNIRLIVTGFFSIVSQALVLSLVFRVDMFEHDATAISTLLPALVHLTRLAELVFFVLSVITIGLHAVAQLIVEGRVTRERIFGHAARWPHMSDDFSIAVIMYGSSCLEANSLSGLNNEVNNVQAALTPYVELGPMGALERIDPQTNQPSIFLSSHYTGVSLPASRGFQTEISDIRAKWASPSDAVPDQLNRNPGVMREVIRFCVAFVRCVIGAGRLVVRLVGHYLGLERFANGQGRIAHGLRALGVRTTSQALSDQLARNGWRAYGPDDGPDDEEDEDFVPDSDSDTSSEEEEDTEQSSREVTPVPQQLPIELYTDQMKQNVENGQDVNSVLLAHLQSQDTLTRTRYGSYPGNSAALREIIDRRRIAEISPERIDQLEIQTICAICRTEPRTCLFWPCRCLAVCNECREQLAAKPSTANQCPTCRKPVEGFSRIFIP